jgi:hypothetical protein
MICLATIVESLRDKVRCVLTKVHYYLKFPNLRVYLSPVNFPAVTRANYLTGQTKRRNL